MPENPLIDDIKEEHKHVFSLLGGIALCGYGSSVNTTVLEAQKIIWELSKEVKINELAVKELAFIKDENWDDRDIPEDEKIRAAHPLNAQTKESYKLYDEAMRLVGAKRSKHALCELVCYLLTEIKNKDARSE